MWIFPGQYVQKTESGNRWRHRAHIHHVRRIGRLSTDSRLSTWTMPNVWIDHQDTLQVFAEVFLSDGRRGRGTHSHLRKLARLFDSRTGDTTELLGDNLQTRWRQKGSTGTRLWQSSYSGGRCQDDYGSLLDNVEIPSEIFLHLRSPLQTSYGANSNVGESETARGWYHRKGSSCYSINATQKWSEVIPEKELLCLQLWAWTRRRDEEQSNVPVNDRSW